MATMKPKTKMGKQAKVGKVMKEYKAGELHSGSKTGPKVTSRAQAIAIGMSEAGMTNKKKPKKQGY
jgi:hypothetical protein